MILEKRGETFMSLRISGKNLSIGETLRGQVETRVSQTLAKYFGGGYSGHVTVEKEGTGFRSECVLHLDSGITLEATGRAHDAYIAFDQTAERLEKRLRRYKTRLKEHPATNGKGNEALDREPVSYSVIQPLDEHEGEVENYHPVVIAETTRDLPLLPVSDAVIQLDLTGVPALVFRHASTARVNVVYRRNDGAIGWVDPPGDAP
jgi:ribosomal subunit interface protein